MSATPVESGFSTIPAPGLNEASAFSRLWRGFMTARVAIAVVLLVLLSTLFVFAPTLNISRWLIGLCCTYLAATMAVRIFTRPLPPGRTFDPQWVSTIGIDLLAFSALQYLQAGGINYSPLFALPVLMGSVLGSALLALGTAAGVALLMLGLAWCSRSAPPPRAPRVSCRRADRQRLFCPGLPVQPAFGRLSREDQAAARGHSARMHAQVNELVIPSLPTACWWCDSGGGSNGEPGGARAGWA